MGCWRIERDFCLFFLLLYITICFKTPIKSQVSESVNDNQWKDSHPIEIVRSSSSTFIHSPSNREGKVLSTATKYQQLVRITMKGKLWTGSRTIMIRSSTPPPAAISELSSDSKISSYSSGSLPLLMEKDHCKKTQKLFSLGY